MHHYNFHRPHSATANRPPVSRLGFSGNNVLRNYTYRLFLGVRKSWRREDRSLPWPAVTIGDLRSDHAGETGAVQIYRGVLAVTRDPDLRSFAEQHLRTEQEHLRVVLSHLPAAHRSRLLPAWRVAGWLTGALPALFGPRAVYSTIAAVETFVDVHYAEQIARLDAMPPDPRRAALRAELEQCRIDEVHHRDEARQSGTANGLPARLWTLAVGRGSAAAVALARRF